MSGSITLFFTNGNGAESWAGMFEDPTSSLWEASVGDDYTHERERYPIHDIQVNGEDRTVYLLDPACDAGADEGDQVWDPADEEELWEQAGYYDDDHLPQGRPPAGWL